MHCTAWGKLDWINLADTLQYKLCRKDRSAERQDVPRYFAGMVSKQCQTEVLSVKLKLSAVSEPYQKLSDGLLGCFRTLPSILLFYINNYQQ